ncbi:hypothetical protein EIN_096180 [Entamoeba invadens IP1]|uniref:Uncharacterized protein n=1 Tax=Entamoeba invadens IP1 TaxID=370355 RepID=A0A0A1U6A4_ENTIV|nr:hypothetical protein EIN_096180 [Entamoeba invadens IP1]ELP87361.1 hypothetical protein EIN_096180 [Entamoeba invadens IP1]|eukprot:XP_004254132.1 hypothetical protein EIN_096180 [Entamoeba invadens IP1]
MDRQEHDSSQTPRCCLHKCRNAGVVPLRRVEGTFKIRSELTNTLPTDWCLCKKHFKKALESMTCSVIGCTESAREYQLPESYLNRHNDNYSHYQICEWHSKELKVAKIPPQKRKPSDKVPEESKTKRKTTESTFEEDKESLFEIKKSKIEKVEKSSPDISADKKIFQRTPEELPQNFTKTEKFDQLEKPAIENLDNPFQPQFAQNFAQKFDPPYPEKLSSYSDLSTYPKYDQLVPQVTEMTRYEGKRCCFGKCEKEVYCVIPFIRPLDVYICLSHYKIIQKLMRKAILDKQLVLSTETLELIEPCNLIKYHPLANYIKTGNDGRCALCFGYHNKKPIYICSSCRNVFCAECQKIISEVNNTNLQQPSAHWKCGVCLLKGEKERENVLRRQVTIVRDAATKRVERFLTEEGKDLAEKMRVERERRVEKVVKRKENIKRIVQFLGVVFPRALEVKWRFEISTQRPLIQNTLEKRGVILFSQTETNYFLCPEVTKGESIVEMLHLKGSEDGSISVRDSNKMVSDELINKCHTQEFCECLNAVEKLNKKVEWSVKLQIALFIEDRVYDEEYAKSVFMIKISKEISEAFCECIRLLGQNEGVKVGYIFTGLKGGKIEKGGVLEKRCDYKENSDEQIVIKLSPEYDDKEKAIVVVMKKSGIDIPNHMSCMKSVENLGETYFLNYTGVGVKYMRDVIGVEKVIIVNIGDDQNEVGTKEILEKEITERSVLYLHVNSLEERRNELDAFGAEFVVVCIDCETLGEMGNERVKKVSEQMKRFTKMKPTSQKVVNFCKVIVVIQHGIVQDTFYDKYKNAVSDFIDVFDKDL